MPSIGSLTAANYAFTNFVNGYWQAVPKEVAVATYTRLTCVSTASATSSTATVTLRATIQDITAVGPSLDGAAGAIRTATVLFVNRESTAIDSLLRRLCFLGSRSARTGI